MPLQQVLMEKLPPALTVGAAAVSVLAAIGSAWLAFLKDRALERTKATYQQEMEHSKAEYQRTLEQRKSELQAELEKRKLSLQMELEQFKAEVADELAAQNARRAYEYEARKRLYAQVEPLLFQVFEAAEGAFHAVTSLVRTQRMGRLPEWLSESAHTYYCKSIIYRLFLPLAIFRLMQRSTTLVDLNLDPSIRLRYAILKEGYLTWTDPHVIAGLEPELQYRPHENNWLELRKTSPAVYWRQGLVIGHLDRLIDSLALGEGASRRPMSFGEWESAVQNNEEMRQTYEIVEDVFIRFEFNDRPVLGRMLIGYACIMHALLSVHSKTAANLDLSRVVSELLDSSEKSAALRWWNESGSDIFAIIRPYVLDRLEQANAGEYVRF